MKIVATDTHTTSFDGLSWESVASLGEFSSYEYTEPELTVSRLADAEIAVVNKTQLSASVLASLPKLRFIAVSATGVNNIDLDAASKQEIRVSNVPGYSSPSVAQFVLACLLDHFCNLRGHTTQKIHSRWCAEPHFSLCATETRELSSLTLGIIGYGDIGKKVATIATAFGMKVVAGAIPGRPENPSRMPLHQLLPEVDALTLHCPLTDHTQGLIGATELSLMQHHAILINTARGGIVEESALAAALRKEEIAAAYSDVLTSEPPSPEHPLLLAQNSFVTPHMSWATREVRVRLIDEVAQNIEAFLQGEERNIV